MAAAVEVARLQITDGKIHVLLIDDVITFLLNSTAACTIEYETVCFKHDK